MNTGGYKLSIDTKKRMSLAKTGLHPSLETRRKISLSKIGNNFGTFGRGITKIGHVPWNKGLKGKGSSWNWIEDRSLIKRQEERNNSEYKQWRYKVWLRDNFTCKIANPDCKGRIEAHHILGWRSYPELRYQINNGITLCHAHHPRTRRDEAKLSPHFQSLVAEMN